MSKKKGLSLDEKRNRLLDLFHEKKEPFLLKDLEKIAPKEKGIPMQTVKDVLTSLVGDDLVDTDKIGTSIYFWAFPSKNFATKANKVKQLEKEVKQLEEKDANLAKEIEEYIKNCTDGKKEAKRRLELQQEITEAEKERNKLQAELDRYKDCDPEMFEQMKSECVTAREAIERWTDNVFAVKSWCKKKFNLEDNEISKNLQIPADFDYFEG